MKKLLLAGVAASALVLNAPVAMADDATGDCGFESVQQTDATGQNYEGAAYGVAVHQDGGSVEITCHVLVNGTIVDSTPTGTGTGVATTADRVTFSASDTDHVQLCADVTAHGETNRYCGDSTNSQIPPQEVIDLLISIAELIDATLVPVWDLIIGVEQAIDPILCSVLDDAPGSYGPVTINSQGDVYIDGEPFWDCPPYDIIWP